MVDGELVMWTKKMLLHAQNHSQAQRRHTTCCGDSRINAKAISENLRICILGALIEFASMIFDSVFSFFSGLNIRLENYYSVFTHPYISVLLCHLF